MSLFFLLHVGFLPNVTWTSITESLKKLEEYEKSGADKLELLGRRQKINMNIRHMFTKLDDDAENFITSYKKEYVQLSVQYFLWHLVQSFLAGFIPVAMTSMPFVILCTVEMLHNTAAAIAVTIITGVIAHSFVPFIQLKIHSILKYRYSPKPFILPDWFIIYLEAREEFSHLATFITSSSHPHLFKFLRHHAV